MKTLKNLILERLKLSKDTQLSKENLYLIFPSNTGKDIFYNKYNKNFKRIIYSKGLQRFEVFIFSSFDNPSNILKNFNNDLHTFIWKLPNDFDIDEFENWFTDHNRGFLGNNIIKLINNKLNINHY